MRLLAKSSALMDEGQKRESYPNAVPYNLFNLPKS